MDSFIGLLQTSIGNASLDVEGCRCYVPTVCTQRCGDIGREVRDGYLNSTDARFFYQTTVQDRFCVFESTKLTGNIAKFEMYSVSPKISSIVANYGSSENSARNKTAFLSLPKYTLNLCCNG